MYIKHTWTISILLLLVLSLIPVPARAQGQDQFPQMFPPDGPYAVGRTEYQWTDPDRDEVHTEAEDDRRSLLVEVWYPAEPGAEDIVSSYVEVPMAMLFSQRINQPVSGVLAIRSNAYPNAPLASAENTYPVVIFDPGFSVAPRRYTVILEELASHGYVVFAVSHPYVTSLTIMPDGRILEALDAEALSSIWAPNDIMDAEFSEAWLPDVLFVLDQIEALNTEDERGLFAGRLDLDHLGMVGHSQGGRTTSEACMLDARCDGVVSLDGGRSSLVSLTFDRPYMLIVAGQKVDEFVAEFDHGLEAVESGYYVLTMLQSNHMSFVDDAFWMGAIYPGELPDEFKIAQRFLYDYRTYIRAFLDKHVRGLDEPLLSGPSEDFPEVFFLARNEPAPRPTDASDPQPVVIGETNRGELAVGAADVWTYEGKAGEHLVLWVMADRPANFASHEERLQLNLMDTLLVVRGPDGSIVALNDDHQRGLTDSALYDVELPADGVYHIEVRTYDNLYAGTYSLMVEVGGGPPEA